MPSITLHNGVDFFYTDTGPVGGDYTTIVIIHGHTFHSGTFQRLNPFAAPNSLRIICVNRREYPGSSPYSIEDLAVFAQGSDAQRAVLLDRQGRDLAMFLDALIELKVPSSGGIALVGWSVGTIYLLAVIASLEALPGATRERLSTHVRSVILLQAPSLALGIPSPAGFFIPHTDPAIAPEARGPAFAKWVSSFFVHGDLSARTLDQLTYSNTDPRKRPTIESLRPEELFGMADFAPGDKYDSIVGLPPFAALVRKQTEKALFDPRVRRLWKGARFWSVYGDAEPWNIIHAAWVLEDGVRAANRAELAISFKVIGGSNHFLVWEDPERAINELKECLAM
ncbi:Alpha/Beta hydrolase protein [Mycena filopes]|nr:Alpha/Beta hydrolase protein [Mycena filopes]